MLTVQEFGKRLIETGDLDPIYLMLNAGIKDESLLARWCLAYWMFYHAGVASKIAEAESGRFWDLCMGAEDKKWPRGTERRHFRGQAARLAIVSAYNKHPSPEEAVRWAATGFRDPRVAHLVRNEPQHVTEVMARVQAWTGFGPWIAFKIADMLDAVLGFPVDFRNSEHLWYDDPKFGAVWVYAQGLGNGMATKEFAQGVWDNLQPKARTDLVTKIAGDLWLGLHNVRRPPVGAGGLGAQIQEVETVLCKYKSHLNGHYPVGKDTREILHALDGWGPLSDSLRQVLYKFTPKTHHG